MKNWKDSLAKFCRENNCMIGIPVPKAEEFIGGIVADLVKAVKVEQERTRLAECKCKEQHANIDALHERNARLQMEMEGLLRQRTLTAAGG